MGACLADGAKVRVTAILNEDIAQLLPYVNAVVKYASFDPGGLTITFKYRGSPVILEKRRVVVGQLDNLDAAEDILDDLMDFLCDVQSKMGQITPVFQPKIQPQPHEIIKLLPRTNCGRCGETTCTAFALKLVLDQQKAENCLPLTGDEIRKVLSVLESFNHQQLKAD
ncbi:hypothetical protein IT084_15015 [Desulfallas sp. Bu1-1]|jgi:ArsR family metal-binding transcriptional regulator|uniref:(Fe-S)-binding protein n=1 Tax=Desulfallas sp. Bu1-1 TaxID=2787620 RepID=UPI00189E16D4|nr:(Fe-S)-binding protein [Desulfallas sp. Bu1-1]MBF7084263.1 hypothetical protein [Desulfallas sp. Bu1-1]